MLQLIPLLLLLTQRSVRASRADFVRAFSLVQSDWSREQVRSVLGPPDVVEHDEYGQEVWKYGVSPGSGMASLGYLDFKDGKMVYSFGGIGTPPSPEVISEAELVKGMRRLDQSRDTAGELLTEIQVANFLISPGQAKALSVLREYVRAVSYSYDGFWMVRAAFVPKSSRPYLDLPMLGAMSPTLPSDLSTWPTYPIEIVDDIPFSLYHGAMLNGDPEMFEEYLEREYTHWTLKTKPLVPADDPFVSCGKLMQRPHFDMENEGASFAYLRMMPQLLKLVRTVYDPGYSTEKRDYSKEDFDRCHKAYLAAGGHWNKARQMYVRANGSTLK